MFLCIDFKINNVHVVTVYTVKPGNTYAFIN